MVSPRSVIPHGLGVLLVLGVGAIALFLGLFFSAPASLFVLAAAWVAALSWRYPKEAFLLLLFGAPLLPILKATQVLSIVTPLKDVVIGALLLRMTIVPIVQKRDPYRRNPLLPALLFLAAWVLLGFLRADHAVLGLLRLRDVLLYVPLLWIARSVIATETDLRVFTKVILGSAALVLALGLVQAVAFPDSMVLRSSPGGERWIPRVSSVLAHPNILGSFLLLTVPLAGALLLEVRHTLGSSQHVPDGGGSCRDRLPPPDRIARSPQATSLLGLGGGPPSRVTRLLPGPHGTLHGSYLALVPLAVPVALGGVAATVLTYSRGSWIALACAGLVLGGLVVLRRQRAIRRFGLLALAAIVVLFLIPGVRTVALTLLDPQYASNATRLQIAAGLLTELSNAEALIGAGLGDVTAGTRREVTISTSELASADVRHIQIAKARTFVDNAILKTWVELGAFGLLIVGWVLVRALRLAWATQAGDHALHRAWGRAVFATTIGLIVLAAFLDVPEIFPVPLTWWSFVGVLEAVQYLGKQES